MTLSASPAETRDGSVENERDRRRQRHRARNSRRIKGGINLTKGADTKKAHGVDSTQRKKKS